jgi:transcriptional regulator with XRE-family HTH domain
MLGKRIAETRQKQGWSQADLAERLRISPSTVGMYEQGRREPPIDVLIAMSEEFGVTIDYLITGKICTLTDPRLSEQANHVMDTISALQDLSREDLMILLIVKLLKR